MVSESLTAALVAYAIATTGLPYPDAGLPSVRFETPQQMEIAVYGDVQENRTFHVGAYYAHADDVIVLKDTWTGATPVEVSDLLHETVHYLQDQQSPEIFAQAATHQCTAAMLERQAYQVQIKYLRSLGVEDPYEAMNLPVLYLMRLTTCNSVHP
jgi:hypothetical protein